MEAVLGIRDTLIWSGNSMRKIRETPIVEHRSYDNPHSEPSTFHRNTQTDKVETADQNPNERRTNEYAPQHKRLMEPGFSYSRRDPKSKFLSFQFEYANGRIGFFYYCPPPSNPLVTGTPA